MYKIGVTNYMYTSKF